MSNTTLIVLLAALWAVSIAATVQACLFVADCRVRRVANVIRDAARDPGNAELVARANHLAAGGR